MRMMIIFGIVVVNVIVVIVGVLPIVIVVVVVIIFIDIYETQDADGLEIRHDFIILG